MPRDLPGGLNAREVGILAPGELCAGVAACGPVLQGGLVDCRSGEVAVAVLLVDLVAPFVRHGVRRALLSGRDAGVAKLGHVRIGISGGDGRWAHDGLVLIGAPPLQLPSARLVLLEVELGVDRACEVVILQRDLAVKHLGLVSDVRPHDVDGAGVLGMACAVKLVAQDGIGQKIAQLSLGQAPSGRRASAQGDDGYEKSDCQPEKRSPHRAPPASGVRDASILSAMRTGSLLSALVRGRA